MQFTMCTSQIIHMVSGKISMISRFDTKNDTKMVEFRNLLHSSNSWSICFS